jgi:hypothetical protein
MKTEQNEIWMCRIFLKRENVAKNRKTKYVQGVVKYLAIMNGDELVMNQTNRRTLGRVFRNELDKNFTIDHVTKVERIKYLGKSLAIE